MVRNPPANAGDAGLIPGSGRSPGGEKATHSSILASEIHGQRSLAGYSPWSCKRIGHNLATKQQLKASLLLPWASPGGSDGKESAWSEGDPVWIPGSGRSPGEGNGYSC